MTLNTEGRRLLRTENHNRARAGPKQQTLWIGLSLALALANIASAQTYQVLRSFGVLTNITGTGPRTPPVLGPDGTLYGAADGVEGPVAGTIFKLNSDGTGFRVLKYFTNSLEGARPDGRLALSGGTLYGTTESGGSMNLGVVFKVNIDGSGYAVLKNFTGSDGSHPYAGLVLAGSTLYGTTPFGGSSSYGVVFKVNTDGSGYTVLKNFSGYDGAYPYADPVLSGSTLYATTGGGGVSDNGVVFKVNTDGSGYAVLKYFTGSDGSIPYSGLVMAGSTLYGTTQSGGSSSGGVVFALNTDGSGYAVLKNFTGSDGCEPLAGLFLGGSTLYGTTSGGGNSNNGVVFKVNTDGSGYGVLKNFTGSDGSEPLAGLLLDGGALYGTAVSGGSWFDGVNLGYGVMFKLNTDGSGYTVLKNFSGASDAAKPEAGLVLADRTLYGTTETGGGSTGGAVFEVNTDGSGYAVLRNFTGSDGWGPVGSLVLEGGTLYGTTQSGGSSANGVVFKINADGSGYSVLKNFTFSDGWAPLGSLILGGSTLYGTTQGGGSSNNGVVFKVNTDGSGFAVLKNFSGGSDGGYPVGDLMLSGSMLYGTTYRVGGWDSGVVFKMNADGSGYTVLKTFGGVGDGVGPMGNLILSGGTLYGTTYRGGSYGYGVVFKVNTDGTSYSVLKSFTGRDGAGPTGLVLAGTTLYGATQGGGSWDRGVIFALITDGSAYAVLRAFTGGSDGAAPMGEVIVSGSALYGTTAYGGDLDLGVVFSFPLLSITTRPSTQTAETGTTVVFPVKAEPPIPVLFYQWFFEGTNALVGATNSVLSLTNVQPVQAGAYTVVVTNAVGAVTSAPALLSVIPPVPRKAVPALTLAGQTASLLNLDTRTTLQPSASWETFDTVPLTNTPQLYFDLATPFALQRFYRAWQTNVLSPPSIRDVHLVPTLTLTGVIGSSVRIDYINQFGPIDAWVPLATVTLTNAAQLYFDTTAFGQPTRLYRLVPLP